MKKLTQILEKTSVFVVDVVTEKKEKDRLYSLGVVPEKIITVIKNSQNKTPLIIEIEESRFVISHDLAKNILVVYVLDEQDFIFDAQHKKTQQRTFILNELKKQKGHFSLDEFTEKLRKKDAKIGAITIYRTIKLLTEKGILETLELADGIRKFEIKKGHHDHIICENCGSIMDFVNEEMEKLQTKIAEQHDVEIESHKMKLFAKNCPNCKSSYKKETKS